MVPFHLLIVADHALTRLGLTLLLANRPEEVSVIGQPGRATPIQVIRGGQIVEVSVMIGERE
jgi:DNA-binding NarL/FixJ family response regulator